MDKKSDVVVHGKRALYIGEKEYNNLCDGLRHLLTLAKKIDKRSDKLHDVICNLNEELREERKQLITKVRMVENVLNRLVVNHVCEREEPKDGDKRL